MFEKRPTGLKVTRHIIYRKGEFQAVETAAPSMRRSCSVCLRSSQEAGASEAS